MTPDQLTIDAIRVLSAEAIEKAKSGHPGLPLGAADAAYALWFTCMRHNPENPGWLNRDRFVLSCGHGSMLLYSLLHITGYGLTMEDIKQFRQLGSRTPGHPEYKQTPGVETSTGPLGQGLANAVGMAMAEARLAAKFNREGFPVIDHYTYAMVGDGCLMEGISHEACSMAGSLGLSKLVVLYDDNEITIEGSTDITFREDVPARFRAYGWNVIDVPEGNDWRQVASALEAAKHSDRPTLIDCHTTIGFASPKAGKASSHGEPLGAENVQALRENLGWTEAPFTLPEAVYERGREVISRGQAAEAEWNALFERYCAAYPELAEEWKVWFSEKPVYDFEHDEAFWAHERKAMATRAASGELLNYICKKLPNLFGGSADLGPSNKTIMKGAGDFSREDYSGSNLHFGIREHAMSAICNGIYLHGGLRPYAATFFVFSDYMKSGMRMSALMGLPIPYILTHDSIGVGEDGPTHQPIEQLAALRSMPGMITFRPADFTENAAGWLVALYGSAPVSLVLTRQSLPVVEGTSRDAIRGAYILSDSEKETPDVILMASGSEVPLVVEAKRLLKAQGVDARVVSVPSFELFDAQSDEYKEKVLPRAVRARVSVEAAATFGWHKYVGLDGIAIGIDSFGSSAPAAQLFPHFGLTAEHVAECARSLVK